MSHYSNCCWTPVPLPHSLFQFSLGLLAAPSPPSPSTLPLCPAPNNSSLISSQPTLLTPCHSLYLRKCICHMDKPLCTVGESHTPGLFPNLFPQTASAPPLGCAAAWPKSQTSVSAPAAPGVTLIWGAAPCLLGDGEKLNSACCSYKGGKSFGELLL